VCSASPAQHMLSLSEHQLLPPVWWLQYDPWNFTGRHDLRDHLLTWHDVGAELMAPYAELRPPWERDMYSQEAVFYMLHGEPPSGRLVSAWRRTGGCSLAVLAMA
jgi:hypothetical protein